MRLIEQHCAGATPDDKNIRQVSPSRSECHHHHQSFIFNHSCHPPAPRRAGSPPTPTAIDDCPQTASVFFKNMIKRCWEPEEEDGKENAIAEADKVVIKANMVNYMCTTPPEVQRQLSEALSIISKSDFPAKWQVRGAGLHAQTRRRRRRRRRRRGDALG